MDDATTDHHGFRPAAVFVHGLFSSAQTWQSFDSLIRDDPDLTNFTILHFEYSSPKFNLNPLRRIPDFNVLADNLLNFLETEAAEFTHLALVSHSQGGLIVQRLLFRMLSNARGMDLQKVRSIIMFACPNSGSEIFLTLRRSVRFWRNPQEVELRPIAETVAEAQKTILSRVVHARGISSTECPIPIYAYAGETDKIVTPASARGVFPETGVLPGDHSTIIQPNSLNHRSFKTLKLRLLSIVSDVAFASEPPDKLPLPVNHITPPRRPMATPSPQATGAEHTEDRSLVVARWNPRQRTIDFILTPEIALSWMKQFGEEDRSNDA